MTEITSQNATGIARGQFDSVSFNVTVEGRGNTGPEAKEETRSAVAALTEAIAGLKGDGITFKDDEDKSTFMLNKETRYEDTAGRHVFSGYLAQYQLQIKSNQVDKASEIQDVLTTVEGAEVASPNFSQEPETRRELQKIAVKAAYEVVKERLAEECSILGIKVEELEIDTWDTNYGQSHSYSASNFAADSNMAMAGYAGGMEAAPIEVKSGLADVQVSLTVGFRRKLNHR